TLINGSKLAFSRNVKDYIFKLIPVEEATRTRIFSTKWRYIWAMLSSLVLANLFCNKIALRSQYIFAQTINKILIQHVRHIIKLDDLSDTRLS
ncbi:hypothetical protein H5410_021088, partial [Solanum commersonii]